jgi:hypothetical protein
MDFYGGTISRNDYVWRLFSLDQRGHSYLAAQAAQKVGLYMGGDGTLIAEKNVSALPAVIFRPNLYA